MSFKNIKSEEHNQEKNEAKEIQKNLCDTINQKFIAFPHPTLLPHRTMQNNGEKIPNFWLLSQSVSSVTQSCLTLCVPMNCSMPGLPVHHQLPESTQTWWCRPTISPSVVPYPPALNLSQHPDLFKWVSSSHQVTKVLKFQLQHQSFQRTPRTDFL